MHLVYRLEYVQEQNLTRRYLVKTAITPKQNQVQKEDCGLGAVTYTETLCRGLSWHFSFAFWPTE
jgi:hypothetical protein